MSKKEEYVENPKLKGSNIIDCIPHTGECPLNCAECFYNGGRFFRTLNEPWMPPVELVGDKIVRVNSGHDSNIDREMVLKATQHFTSVFYNTAIGKGIDKFPAPVVFTCNGGPTSRLKLLKPVPRNLMFVRVRVDSWDMETVDRAVKYYWEEHGVPVVLTFMRFYDGDLIPEEAKDDYEWRKNVTNSYWCPRVETVLRIAARYKGQGVRTCGTPVSSSCFDCRNCEFLYWDCLRRINK
ncbi:hypothetical protein KJ885_05340 [Patescibacteria group bacterium]|nr:hypothetical protein [Patescibacteria group bacterium]